MQAGDRAATVGSPVEADRQAVAVGWAAAAVVALRLRAAAAEGPASLQDCAAVAVVWAVVALLRGAAVESAVVALRLQEAWAAAEAVSAQVAAV